MHDAPLITGSLPMMPWLSEETLFSWVSRHHRLWGAQPSSWTSIALFGRPRAGVHHDLPNALQSLADRTCGVFGSAIEIAINRTLLGFFRPFLSADAGDVALRWMCSPSVAHLKFKMGLLTSRFGAHHPLKACLACVEDDIRMHGWPYWHLPHQIPGVWICPAHQEILRASTLKATGVQRFSWLLPSQQHWAKKLELRDIDTARRFGAFILRVASSPIGPGQLHSYALASTVTSLLWERGLLTHAGHVRQRHAAQSFLECCARLRELPDMVALPSGQADAECQLGRLLRGPRSGTHPLRTLSLLFWLLPDEQRQGDFVRSRQLGRGDQSATRSETLAVPQDNTSAGTQKAAGHSLEQTPKLRPKRLKGDLREAIVHMLREGGDPPVVSGECGVSLCSVYRVLRNEPGLLQRWRGARFRSERLRMRRKWAAALRNCPTGGAKTVRCHEPATFTWLYRHDAAWLRAHTPARKVVQHRASSVDWPARDRQLSQEVISITEALRSSGSKGPLRLWQIYQLVPNLRRKLSALPRLPLTAAAIAQMTRPKAGVACGTGSIAH